MTTTIGHTGTASGKLSNVDGAIELDTNDGSIAVADRFAAPAHGFAWRTTGSDSRVFPRSV